MNERRAIIEVHDLTMRFDRVKGFRRKVIGEVRAVDGVSFTLDEGETLALVGESGSGKTTTGRCLVRAVEPTGGSVMYDEDGTMIDVLSLPRKELNRVRQKIRMVFQ
ncbi:ATP-binding cassette domain-containing protein, partial [bacterium]|nr:ATP-binding cassette domain-containing protein [bacterium]